MMEGNEDVLVGGVKTGVKGAQEKPVCLEKDESSSSSVAVDQQTRCYHHSHACACTAATTLLLCGRFTAY